MNLRRTAYLVIFILIVGAFFVIEVRLPPGFPFGNKSTGGTGPHLTCTKGWNITGYYTPVESDFSGATQALIVNGTSRTFYASFLSEVRVEGWGKTNAGDYVGYENGIYLSRKVPLNSLDLPLRVGDVAVDFALIPPESNLTIPTLPSPWNTTNFAADDSGPDIVGKHVDVYTGLGAAAKQVDYELTSSNQTVCAYLQSLLAPAPGSLVFSTAHVHPKIRFL